MATTTNFNWETPDDTDLVKDGAAAMRTLGNSIDASFVDLKGGTTGQILSKASNTDLDYTWITNDVGDITAVIAGTGISGGGTSGAVTITNSMATAIDAKGDLIAGTGADAFSRLAIGTNGQVLTADSAEATGIKWATPSSAVTFSGVAVNRSTDLSTSNNVVTSITFDTEIYDTDGYHSTSTNTERLTIPAGKSGYFLWIMEGAWETNTSNIRQFIFYKNGTRLNTPNGYESITSSAGYPTITRSYVLNLTAGDYIEVRAYQGSGSTLAIRKEELQQSLTFLGA